MIKVEVGPGPLEFFAMFLTTKSHYTCSIKANTIIERSLDLFSQETCEIDLEKHRGWRIQYRVYFVVITLEK